MASRREGSAPKAPGAVRIYGTRNYEIDGVVFATGPRSIHQATVNPRIVAEADNKKSVLMPETRWSLLDETFAGGKSLLSDLGARSYSAFPFAKTKFRDEPIAKAAAASWLALSIITRGSVDPPHPVSSAPEGE